MVLFNEWNRKGQGPFLPNKKEENMPKNIGIIIILATVFSSPALAASPKEKGFFLGGAFGAAELDDDGAFSWLDFDDSDSSLALFAGYKFIPYFAIEGRVSDLGTYTISDGFSKESLEATSLSVHAVGLVPFGQSGWELYGQLGIGSIEFDCIGCSDETAGSAGLGIRYSFGRQLAVGAQIDAYAWEEDDFDFSIATTQLIIQYLF